MAMSVVVIFHSVAASCSPLHHFYFLFIFVDMWIPYTAAVLNFGLTNACINLFLIYINDFPEYLSYSKLRLFADDSIIYRGIKTQDDCLKLQQDLDLMLGKL
jgi:hypothetical protein